MASGRELDRYRSLAAAQRQQQEAELVREYAPLVKRIAHHLSHRLPPTVELDDLLQAGTLGFSRLHENLIQAKVLPSKPLRVFVSVAP